MILVDPREGSGEVLDYILSQPGHPPAQHEQMAFGDIAFVGNGPLGPMAVGIELKAIGEAIQCIETQRFTGHQAQGLKNTYDVPYLMVWGEFRAAWDTGALQIKLDKGKGEFWWGYKVGSRTWTHYEFMAWLTMVEVGWGIRTRIVRDMKEAARSVVEMYRVLQKEWTEHKTTNPFYLGPAGNTPFVEPSLVEKVVAQVKGIGQARAREIGKRFPSVIDMLSASPVHHHPPSEEFLRSMSMRWKGIPGIGKSTVRRIIKEFWGMSSNSKED